MSKGIKIIATNKKASFNYFLSDFIEAGIELKGTEIKSLRVNGATIGDSYVVIRNGEAEILNISLNYTNLVAYFSFPNNVYIHVVLYQLNH